MFARRARRISFTDSVRVVRDASREEALRLSHDRIEPEHILLALLRAGDEPLMERLRALSFSTDDLYDTVLSALPAGTGHPSPIGDLPFSLAGKNVVEQAMREAIALDARVVGTLHLLLAMLHDERRPAVRKLRDAGLTRERLLTVAPAPAPAPFRIEIDDSATVSIYEQIVAQITEGIATGVLRPGARLPTVRQLADHLDVAPGTVARAYARLESQNIVVTDGARGTRVAERPAGPDPALTTPENLAALLRPVAVAAFHLGATAAALREGLEQAMRGIFPEDGRE